jgi:hypothetical protein
MRVFAVQSQLYETINGVELRAPSSSSSAATTSSSSSSAARRNIYDLIAPPDAAHRTDNTNNNNNNNDSNNTTAIDNDNDGDDDVALSSQRSSQRDVAPRRRIDLGSTGQALALAVVLCIMFAIVHSRKNCSCFYCSSLCFVACKRRGSTTHKNAKHF